MSVTVGNLDSDPELEILVSGYASGPLWAFNHDGTGLEGWPEEYGPAVGYPSLGNFLGGVEQLEVASGYGPFFASCNFDRFVFDGRGEPITGWPNSSCSAGTTSPPQIADIDGDGVDEIFFGGDAYRADGQPLMGWPPSGFGDVHLFAFGDVDGDSVDEVIALTHSQIRGYEFDGSIVAGFPFDSFPSDDNSSLVAGIVVGDMDGDGLYEIIEVRKEQNNPAKTFVRVHGADGALRWERETLPGESVDVRTAPALADLDGDGLPEIVVQVNGALYVWQGDGTLVQGWPVRFGDRQWLGNSAPVIGDVDGDRLPDIVVTTYHGQNEAEVFVFDRTGQLHPAFPKTLLLGPSMAPAIADMDLDGRNEILIGSTFWDGDSGMKDAVYAFDLGGPAHGPILWGQVGGGPRHQYRYPPR